MHWLIDLWQPVAGLVFGGAVAHYLGWRKAKNITGKAHGWLTYALHVLTEVDNTVIKIHEAVEDEKVSGEEFREIVAAARATVKQIQDATTISDAVAELES